jgi:hypothetical protein
MFPYVTRNFRTVEREAFFDGMAQVFFAIEELRESLRELPSDAAQALSLSIEALRREADALLAAGAAETVTLRQALHQHVAAVRRDRTVS